MDGIEIVNIRADGTRQASMKGVVVPRNEKTEVAYQILISCLGKGKVEKNRDMDTIKDHKNSN
jgi:hypothetical protein